MTLEMAQDWVRQVALDAMSSPALLLGWAVLLVLWLMLLVASRRRDGRLAQQVRVLERRLASLEVSRDKDGLWQMNRGQRAVDLPPRDAAAE